MTTHPLARRPLEHRGVERRSRRFSGTAIKETRSTAGVASCTLTGYASVANEPYSVHDSLGEFTEVVRAGAFYRTLADGADVVFLLNHEGARLARTRPGTLRLTEDSVGLHLEARFDPGNAVAAVVRPAVERGDLDAFSFAFKATKQTWSTDYLNREHLGVDINGGDCSIVNFPANGATGGSASFRSPVHANMTGKHSHSHTAKGSQGTWRTHTHEHVHLGDANHDHDHDHDALSDADAPSDSSDRPNSGQLSAFENHQYRIRIATARAGVSERELQDAG